VRRRGDGVTSHHINTRKLQVYPGLRKMRGMKYRATIERSRINESEGELYTW